jgi:hypothetical protein
VRDPAVAVLHDLRRTRQHHRLGNLEWFEAAYRVYIVALFGGGSVLWISSSVGDQPVAMATATSVDRNGPAVLGLLAVLALLAGLRSGAQGGPLALESPDIAHVMLSPVDRWHALLRPAVQRVRSAAYAGVVGGAIVGQLAGRRMPGSTAAWAASGALYGLSLALLWVGAALVAHGARLPLWAATGTGIALTAWQLAAVVWHVTGPANTLGSLALWGWRQHAVDLTGLVLGIALTAVGIARLRQTSLDALARRSSLVAQLRFAVTMQDLRTVVLLRRQLNQERTRNRPWVQLPRGHRGHAIWRRGWHSLLRLPLTRLVRMATIAAAAGVLQGMVMRGTTPALAAAGLLLFLLGLEVAEPLSQEIDQPDRADSLPIERGELLVRHLAAPAVALVPFAAIATAAALLTACTGAGAITTAAVVGLPMTLAGAAGAVVSIVRDAADPVKSESQTAMMLPEMAGLSMVLKVLIPLVVSVAGAAAILFVRQAERLGTNTVAAGARAATADLLIVTLVTVWVKQRDRATRWFRSFMAAGRSDYSARPQQPRGGLL